MILIVGQVFAHELAHELKKLIELFVAQPRDQNLEEIIFGEFLQIDTSGNFHPLPVKTQTLPFRHNCPQKCDGVLPQSTPPDVYSCFVVHIIIQAEMGDLFFAHEVAQGVLELHQLNEKIVLRIEVFLVHGALEIE